MGKAGYRYDFALWGFLLIFLVGIFVGYLICSILGDPSLADVLGRSP